MLSQCLQFPRSKVCYAPFAVRRFFLAFSCFPQAYEAPSGSPSVTGGILASVTLPLASCTKGGSQTGSCRQQQQEPPLLPEGFWGELAPYVRLQHLLLLLFVNITSRAGQVSKRNFNKKGCRLVFRVYLFVTKFSVVIIVSTVIS